MTERVTEFYQQFLEPGDYTRPPLLRGSGPAIHNSRALQLVFMLMTCQSQMPSTNDHQLQRKIWVNRWADVNM